MKVLVLAPHPDDETIGCGGSVILHTMRGDRVVVVCFTSGELGLKHLPVAEARSLRESEALAAGRVLGIERTDFLRAADWGVAKDADRLGRALAALLNAEAPDVVYLPHPGDDHPDHRVVWPILRHALRERSLPAPELRAYEVWSPLPAFDRVEDITRVYSRKVKALKAYPSQLVEFDYLRAMRGLNQYRGVLAARVPYAEVFQTLIPETGGSESAPPPEGLEA